LNGAIVPARSGFALFIANNAYSAGIIGNYGPEILAGLAESRLSAEGFGGLPDTSESEQLENVALRRLALGWIADHPLATIRLKIANLLRFFSPLLVPRFGVGTATSIRLEADGQATVNNGRPRSMVEHVAYTVPYAVVLVLAAAGAYMRRREFSRDAILWCTLATFAGVHAVFFPSTRYRAPVEFILLFYAGVAAAAWFEQAANGPPPWPDTGTDSGG
jgi:hypothetical protein